MYAGTIYPSKVNRLMAAAEGRRLRKRRKMKKRRISLRPIDGGAWCICDDWNSVGQMIEEDGAYEFRFVEMTDEEYEALGDFPGW